MDSGPVLTEEDYAIVDTVLRALGPPPSIADQLRADLLAPLADAARRWNGVGRRGGWLWHVVYTQAVRTLQTKCGKSVGDVDEREYRMGELEDAETAMDAEAIRAKAEQVLTPRQYIIFMARHSEDGNVQTFSVLARQFGCTTSQVEYQYRVLMDELRQALR